MRPPQTPYNELANKRWNENWRFMRAAFAKLFFDWDQLWGLVSYSGDPIFTGGRFRDPDYPPAVNDNQRG